MKRAVTLFLAPLLLFSAGCSSSEMMESMERGIDLEIKARKLERGDEPKQAAQTYAAAAKDYEHALAIAKERENRVFQSFLVMKLSITSFGQGRCVQPDADPAGSWEAAIEHYRKGGTWAIEGNFLKMKENAIMAEANCLRPDKNAKGSWKAAVAMYAKAVKLAKSFGDDEGRGKALRNQAVCMLEGDLKKELTPEIRFMLVKARQLGDEEASDMLVKGRYCMSCGEPLPAKGKFCPKCGKDQATKPKGKKTFKLKRRLRPGEQGPGANGSPPN